MFSEQARQTRTEIGARAATFKYIWTLKLVRMVWLSARKEFSYRQDSENCVVIDQYLTARVAGLNNNVTLPGKMESVLNSRVLSTLRSQMKQEPTSRLSSTAFSLHEPAAIFCGCMYTNIWC